VRHYDTISALTAARCLPEAAASIPPDLQVILRNDRFFYSKTKTPVVVPIPLCVQDIMALSTSYLSHGAIEPSEVWELVAPVAILQDTDDGLEDALGSLNERDLDAVRKAAALHKRELSGHRNKVALLVVGRRNAFFFQIFPATALLKRLFLVAAGFDPDRPEGIPDTVRLDQEVAIHTVRDILHYSPDSINDYVSWQRQSLFLAILLVCGFCIGLLTCFDVFVTGVLLIALVRHYRMGPSFRFWTIRRHLGAERVREFQLDDQTLEAEQRELEVQLRDNAEVAAAMFADLPDTVFLGISIHSATWALLVDAIFPLSFADPIIIADTIGLGAIVHILLTMCVVRYLVLPDVIIDMFVSTRPWYRRAPTQPSLGPDAPTRGNQQATELSLPPASTMISRQTEWGVFCFAQQLIAETLRLPNVPLDVKLVTAVSHMRAVYKELNLSGVDILHVWSVRNKTPGATGGPGWCYGRSHSSGAWVMLCWYDRPDSAMGINALAAFPGHVHISPDECPASLIPSKPELEATRLKLDVLKRELAEHREREASVLRTGQPSTAGWTRT